MKNFSSSKDIKIFQTSSQNLFMLQIIKRQLKNEYFIKKESLTADSLKGASEVHSRSSPRHAPAENILLPDNTTLVRRGKHYLRRK